MKYYYLVASLPLLKFGMSPPVTEEDFLFQCTGVLADKDKDELRYLQDYNRQDCTTRFVKDYLDFEISLRFGISGVRAGRLGLDIKDYKDHDRGYNTFVNRTVVDAFAKSNPRERARVADKARWFMLDELSRQEPFGLASVLAYSRKIHLLSRWDRMDTAKGQKKFNQYVENILSTVQLEAK